MDLIPIILIFFSYLLGSISGSMIIGKFKKVDIRTMGSGNAGGTNAFRTQGVLFALGVLHVGLETSGLMTRHFGSLKRLSVATINELISIQGIGQKIADSVRSYFGSEGNRLIINKLDIAGVKLYSSDVIHPPKGDILQGRYFCLTGSLSSMSRADAQWKIEQLGGQIVDRVTRKTTHLIVGGAPGSKLGVAKSLGIPIISEDDFLALLLDEGLGPSN